MLPIWIALQVLALLLAAGRVPLSARFTAPAERAATAEMAVVQIVGSALLFPDLLSDIPRSIVAAAVVWPMLKLASLLGGDSTVHVYLAAGYVTCWMGLLAAWRRVLRTERWRMIGVAAVSLWAIGGPVLLYLHSEFGGGNNLWPGEGGSGVWEAVGGPVWGVLERLWGETWIGVFDIPLIAVFAGGFLAAIFNLAQSRQSIHRLSP